MIGRRYKSAGLALAAIISFPALAPAQTAPAPAASKATPEQSAVIAAVVSFSIGYGVWLWEKKCNSLPADLRRQFDEVITDDLKRLTAAADAKLLGAATSSGQKTAGGSDVPACASPDAAEFGQFGLEMAKDAQVQLKTLPPGYRMVITD